MKGRRTLLIFGGIFVLLLVVLLLQNISLGRPSTGPSPDDVTYQRTFPDIATAADVRAVQLQDPTSGKSFTISRQIDGSWTAPNSTGTLRPDTGERIATTIALLPYRQVLPTLDKQALTSYGFQPKPALLIQAVLKTGQSHVVAIGGLTPAQTSYYGIVDQVQGVYVLERGPIDFLMVQLRTPPVA